MSNKLKPLDYCTKSPLVNRKSILPVDVQQKKDIIAIINKTILTDDYSILNSLSDEYITSIDRLINPINQILTTRLADLKNTKPHRPNSSNSLQTIILKRRASMPSYRTLPKIEENKINNSNSPTRRKSFSGITKYDPQDGETVVKVEIKDVIINFDVSEKKKKTLTKIIKSFVLIEKEIVNIDNKCDKKKYKWFNNLLSFKIFIKHSIDYTYNYSVVTVKDNELTDTSFYKVETEDELNLIFCNTDNKETDTISVLNIPNMKDKLVINSIRKNLNLENTLKNLGIVEELFACLLSPLKYDDILYDYFREKLPVNIGDFLDKINIEFT